MKNKFSLLILLLLIGSSLWAIEPIMKVKAKLYTSNTKYLLAPSLVAGEVYPENTLSLDIVVGGIFYNFIWIEGEVETWEAFPDNFPGFFQPYQSDYGIRAGIKWNGFTLGWSHNCYHPAITYGKQFAQMYGGQSSFILEYEL